MQEAKRLIRKRVVQEKTGLSGMTIDRREAAGDFPRRVRLGANAVAWIEDEVEDWIDARAKERGPLRQPQGLLRAREASHRRRAGEQKSSPTGSREDGDAHANPDA